MKKEKYTKINHPIQTLRVMEWILVKSQLPPEGKVVDTKLEHNDGSVTNEQPLIRKNNLWFFTDMSMYVYYTPTHWKQ